MAGTMLDEGGGDQVKVDYYSVLGCDPASSEDQILTEYRVRARQTHPDKDGDKEEFQVELEAYKENNYVKHLISFNK